MKVWWQSKTLWFNVLTLVGLALAHFLNAGLISDPQVVAYLTEVVALVNLVLRFFTGSELKMR